MKQSLTYHLTLFVIKLKGLKKIFSQDPIDFKKLRKEDVHQPKGSFFKQKLVRRFKVLEAQITEVKQQQASNGLLIFIPGGAFISGPAKHHWDTLKSIHQQTDHSIWMCDYPKAPETKIEAISQTIDALYKEAMGCFPASQITLMGDSAGGTLILALVQRLINENKVLPHKIILITPMMDATLSNPKIDAIDSIDVMLSKQGVLSAKKMCAGSIYLKDPMISPLYGSFENFPHTILFMAENDIAYPDQLLAAEKLRKTQTRLDVIEGKGMPHIWPLLPVMKEAKVALRAVIRQINNETD